MGGLFGSSKTPEPQAPPPAPTREQAEEKAKLAKRKRMKTILTSPVGLLGDPVTMTKTLLGG